MESVKLKKLLDSYLEGTTTLAQESDLRSYFSKSEVTPDLAPYKAMFTEFSATQTETYNKPLSGPKNNLWHKPWRYGVAALLVIGLTVAYFMMPSDGLTKDERMALAKFEEFKSHMQMISGELNNGLEELAYLGEFEKATNKIFK